MNTLESSSTAPAWPARTRMRTLNYEHAPQSAAVTLLQSVEVKLLLLSTIPSQQHIVPTSIVAFSFRHLFLFFTPPGDNCPLV